MGPPDDGRVWLANTTGEAPDIGQNELIWAWLDDDRPGGSPEQQRTGFRVSGWAWRKSVVGGHYVAYWTADPPFAPKSGADLIAILLRAQDGSS